MSAALHAVWGTDAGNFGRARAPGVKKTRFDDESEPLTDSRTSANSILKFSAERFAPSGGPCGPRESAGKEISA